MNAHLGEKKQHKTLSKKSYIVKLKIFALDAISMRLCGDDKEETAGDWKTLIPNGNDLARRPRN